MNKLDYLAQKEEELRKLNEQLDQRKQQNLQQPLPPPKEDFADSLDMRKTGIKNPFEEQPGESNNEEDIMRQSSSSLMSEARKVRESYKKQEE